MNVILSNLSHDLDASLAYSIDREVWEGPEPDLVALVSGLGWTPRPRPWPRILPRGQGRLLLFGEQCRQHRAAFCGSRHVRAPCRRGCRQISAWQSKRAQARIVYACRHRRMPTVAGIDAVITPARPTDRVIGVTLISLACGFGCGLPIRRCRRARNHAGPRTAVRTCHRTWARERSQTH
jgi:hypothetical protein